MLFILQHFRVFSLQSWLNKGKLLEIGSLDSQEIYFIAMSTIREVEMLEETLPQTLQAWQAGTYVHSSAQYQGHVH